MSFKNALNDYRGPYDRYTDPQTDIDLRDLLLHGVTDVLPELEPGGVGLHDHVDERDRERGDPAAAREPGGPPTQHFDRLRLARSGRDVQWHAEDRHAAQGQLRNAQCVWIVVDQKEG